MGKSFAAFFAFLPPKKYSKTVSGWVISCVRVCTYDCACVCVLKTVKRRAIRVLICDCHCTLLYTFALRNRFRFRLKNGISILQRTFGWIYFSAITGFWGPIPSAPTSAFSYRFVNQQLTTHRNRVRTTYIHILSTLIYIIYTLHDGSRLIFRTLLRTTTKHRIVVTAGRSGKPTF